jgi:ribose 5-phosphate isomerase A
VDIHLNAFKSGGGVHTGEKIMANMAKQFILLVDGSKMVDKLTTNIRYVLKLFPTPGYRYLKLKSSYSSAISNIVLRKSEQKSGLYYLREVISWQTFIFLNCLIFLI